MTDNLPAGFARHNIGHLSASSINLWTNAPDVWVVKYLLGKNTGASAAMERGKAVEQAVVWMLDGRDDAIDKATESYNAALTFEAAEDADTQRNLIAPMAQEAHAALSEYGPPSFETDDGQRKVSIAARLPDGVIPVIGYLDLVYPKHGLVVDLKTTTRVPSVMSADHQLQRAIYARAMSNHAVRFLYVSGKKHAWLEDGDPTAILANAKTQIARLNRFLIAHDAESARACVPVNPNSFYWRGAEPLRREIYGL